MARRLKQAAREWLRMERDFGLLYCGIRLEQARQWAATHDATLDATEREFLAAGRDHDLLAGNPCCPQEHQSFGRS